MPTGSVSIIDRVLPFIQSFVVGFYSNLRIRDKVGRMEPEMGPIFSFDSIRFLDAIRDSRHRGYTWDES